MDIGELVAVGFIDQLDVECPLQAEEKPDPTDEAEDILDDDVDANQASPSAGINAHIEKNSGSKLGENLLSGAQGADGTVIDPPAPAVPQPKITADQITVNGSGTRYETESAGRTFPYTVAAHHLIPGNASLRKSEVYKYMARSASGSKVTKNIGYNINGAHNGIFLAGWYGIRTSTSPNGMKWSELDQDWQQRYVGAVVARTGRQFHDSHTAYSDTVTGILDSLATSLLIHSMFCEDCGKEEKTPPHYAIKTRLYSLSGMLRGALVGHPVNWKRSLMTSDKWTDYQLGQLKSDMRSLIRQNPIPADGGGA